MRKAVGQDEAVPAPVSAPRALRADRSVSLLVDVLAGTLDSSYREAAERSGQAQQVATAGAAPFRGGVLPVLVVVGLLAGTAAAQVRGRGDDVLAGRAALVGEVRERTGQSDALAGRLETARAAFTSAQAQALGATEAGRREVDRLAGLELGAAAVPVRGPGLLVRLDDAPRQTVEVEVRGGQAAPGRVLDRDLQDAVNGLWAAGAEAVSVNGLRLSALTAIRAAGEAVLVDFRPLSPPYVLRAVGASASLERRFRTGDAGRRLATYPDLYGFRLEVRRARVLDLPAARLPDLRTVRLP